MSANTAIEWTDYSWSPWWGCTPVSPGCANCYAARWAKFTRGLEYRRGTPRQLAKDWKTPLKWNKDAGLRDERRRVFLSMCDPFDDEVPTEWRLRLTDLIQSTPNLDWLLLTKRPEHVAPVDWLPNVWLGVSVEDQQRADERIPALLKIPTRLRFVSFEPLLEAIDLSKVEAWRTSETGMLPDGSPPKLDIGWSIVGGESGPNARPCNIEWIRSIVRQCREAGVPCFVKQMGSKPIESDLIEPMGDTIDDFDYVPRFKHRKGGDPSEWPEDLRVREFPTV